MGFTLYPGDRKVAFRWLDNPTCRYETSSACWGMEVLSEDGCSSLYVEITILDTAGTVIDSSNDTASAMLPGQRARLTFESFEDSAQKARIADINCR